MNTCFHRLAWLLLSLTLAGQSPSALAQGTAFTYQGRLQDNGQAASGFYDFRFRLFADPSGSNQVGASFFTNGLPVTAGLFLATLDFGAGVFNGSNYWLEVGVRTNNPANTLVYTVLNPCQALLPAPYAVFANSASNLSGKISAAQVSGMIPSANLEGTYGNVLTLSNAANSFNGSGTGLTALNAASLASGTVPLPRLSGLTSNQLDAATWQLATNRNGGNATLASNVVSGLAITNAFITNSVIAGSFSGNGSGLTNLPGAYAHVYLTFGQAVDVGAPILFNTTGPYNGFVFSGNSLTASTAGTYMIEYEVLGGVGSGYVSLAIDGAPVPGSTLSTTPGRSSHTLITTLNAGDFIQVYNSGIVSVNLSAPATNPSSTAASMTITKLH